MEYLIVAVIILLLGTIIFYINFKIKERKNKGLICKKQENIVVNSENKTNDLSIRLEKLSVSEISDNSKLMEIKDNKVISKINNLVPELFQAGVTTANAINTSSETLYRAIIPIGTELVKSKEIDGAFRGFTRNANNITSSANLMPVQQSGQVVSNVASSAMGVASMVVGQYYMEQISSQLDVINQNINKISNFQDNEYKSKVFALLAQIQKTSKFQSNIIENKELRYAEIANINNWEQECIQLLGQANLTISSYTDTQCKDYKEYEKNIVEIQNWCLYQKTLMDIIVKISDLKHTLYLGEVSKEQCGALIEPYFKQVNTVLSKLSNWHLEKIEKLKINITDASRQRMGFDKIVHLIPSIINEQNNYRSISSQTTENIITQTSGFDLVRNEEDDLFNKDVSIIVKENKVYYLIN